MMQKTRVRIPRKSLLAVLFLGMFILLGIAGVGAGKAAASIYPYNDGNPWDAGHHYAISAYFGDWSPSKKTDGSFINNTGQYNCQYPSIYPPSVPGNPYQDPGACETILPASTTRYKLFRPDTGAAVPTTTLYLVDGCKDVDNTTPFDKPTHPNKGARTIEVEIHQTQANGAIGAQKGSTTYNYTGGDCSGQDLVVSVPGSAFTKNQQNRYGTKVLTALVVVRKHLSLPGNKMFKLVYGSGQVFGDDGAQYALADDRQSDPDPDHAVYTSYSFKFVTDCRYNGAPVSLGADALNIGNKTIQAVNVDLYLQSPGSTVKVKKILEDGKYNLGVLAPRVPYTIWLVNVGTDNGIRVTLPYGEFVPPPDDPCPSTGSSNVSGACFQTRVQDDGSTTYSGQPAKSITQVDINGNPAVNNGEVGYGHSHDYTWHYVPAGPSVTVTQRHLVKPDGAANYINIGTSTTTYPCNTPESMHVSCNIDSIDPDASASNPYDLVLVNHNFIVTATVTNDGTLTTPADLGGHWLSLNSGDENAAGSDWNGIAQAIGNLNPGEDKTIQFSLPAGSDIADKTLKLHPAYSNLFAFTPPSACSATVSTFQHFNIDPSAQITTANQENPISITYVTSGTKTEGPDIGATANSWLTKQPDPGSPATVKGVDSIGHTYGSVSDTFTYPVPSVVAGDNYCAYVTISPAKGYYGAGGKVVGGEPVTAQSNCLKVHNEPYVHFLGGDVTAGGGFDGTGSCMHDGGIYTYTNETGIRPAGSGVQIGALAIGPIMGFNSANLRNIAPTASTGLSFSNTNGAGGSGAGAPTLGGNLGGRHCAADYFGKKPDDTPVNDTATSISFNSGSPSGTTWYKPPGGTLTINSAAIGDGANINLYVSGNVYIANDIRYVHDSWPSLDSIPSMRIIVKGGNIYVGPNVGQLDGLYVAQPDGPGGIINTCATNTTQFSGGALLSSCRRQLVVNGAFVAQQVVLNRSFGSLRNSSSGERYKNATIKDCGDSGNTALGDCAAEIFNFSPEIYLPLNPGSDPISGPATGKFDFINSLSPRWGFK